MSARSTRAGSPDGVERGTSLWRICMGVSLVSASVLALQVIFTRVFSFMIWHHFTYLIVGIALLGMGAAGAFHAMRRDAVRPMRLDLLAALYSASILLTLLLIGRVRFDPLRAGEIARTIGGLAIYFCALFGVFFLGGLTAVSAVTQRVQSVHRIYFADLVGGSVSVLLVAGIVRELGGTAAIAAVALLPAIASLLFAEHLSVQRATVPGLLVLIETLLVVLFFARPLPLHVPASKALGWAIGFMGNIQPELTIWNPVARVDVMPPVTVDQPMIVGGLSAAHAGEFSAEALGQGHELRFVTLDGTSMTGLYRFDGDLAPYEYLHHAIISAGYQITVPEPSALLIGVGGGIDIILARLYGAREVTAIDINGDVIELIDSRYAEYTGYLGDHPNTSLLMAEGRSFLTRTTETYDLIQGIGLDNIAALSSGAYVLSESYIYTVEAFQQALARLSPQGVLSWTRDSSNPPSETLRLVGLAAEALRRDGVSDPAAHIAIVANDTDSAVTMLVLRQPLDPDRMARLREWTEDNRFLLKHDPFVRLDTPYADYLHAPNPRAFEENYIFSIGPVTDDRPFYYNHYRWSRLRPSADVTGHVFVRFPVGNIILLTMLGLSSATAIAFLVVPLWRRRGQRLDVSRLGPSLAYFGLLGMAYIMVEIVLIQRLTLLIGYPTRAITTTIFGMLLFSALGSLTARRVCRRPRDLVVVLGVLAIALALYGLGSMRIVRALLNLPDWARSVAGLALIGPVAFLMGMPFPTALARIGARDRGLVAWAWSVNGAFSVWGSTLVVIVGMAGGFSLALGVAALAYGLAAVASPSLWPTVAVTHDSITSANRGSSVRVEPAHESGGLHANRLAIRSDATGERLAGSSPSGADIDVCGTPPSGG